MVAEQYGLHYEPRECHHEGGCPGTCPVCDAELQDLQRQLDEKGIDVVLPTNEIFGDEEDREPMELGGIPAPQPEELEELEGIEKPTDEVPEHEEGMVGPPDDLIRLEGEPMPYSYFRRLHDDDEKYSLKLM